MLITIDNRTIELSDEQVSAFHALTRLQQGVALGVLEGLSQREAYRRAGGKAKSDVTADTCVSELLSNPKVDSFVKMFKNEQTDRLAKVNADRDKIIAMLHEQATVDLKLQDLNKPENFKHISEVVIEADGEVRYKLTGPADRRAAAKQLADMLGWNKPQQVEVTGAIATNVTPQQVIDFKKAFNETF